MTNATITETYKLPSGGKIYDVPVNPIVRLRSMTTNEEMKRLAPSERQYKNICEIIDDCLIDNPGISSYDMCLGDYQYLLHKLRVVTYGPEYSANSTCPYCNFPNEGTISLEDLQVFEYNEDLDKYLELDLPKSKHHIRLRMQTPRMIDDIVEKSKDFKKRNKAVEGDSAFLFTVQSLIVSIDGEKANPLTITDFVRNLPMMDTNLIVEYADKLNESIGLNMRLDNVCEMCGLDYTTFFRLTKEFFRPRVDI